MAALVVTALLGLGLYAAPELLGYDGPARISHLIVGPIAAAIAFIAMSDVARELRWLNFLLGAWLVLSPLLLPHEPPALFAGVAAGMAITALAVVRGPINQGLGGGWRAVLDPNFKATADEPARANQHSTADGQGGRHEQDT